MGLIGRSLPRLSDAPAPRDLERKRPMNDRPTTRPGPVAMLVTMRIDYRLLRLVSLPGYVIAVALLILVFVPSLNRVVGGSARWLAIAPLPAIHPAEIAKLALVVYLAHWMASRGTRITSIRSGTLPFLLIALPVIGLVFKEPDLGTTTVIALTALTMFFVAGARLWQFGAG